MSQKSQLAVEMTDITKGFNGMPSQARTAPANQL
jgi:hypothetical protein